jgi:excinuclease UvrABC nuclease subunit
MKEAAERRHFERAADLRDQLESLAWLRETLERSERARLELTLIYPVVDELGAEWWFLIERGQPRALASLAEEGTARLRRLIRQVYLDKPCLGGPNDGQEDRELLWLVASWFRRRPGERARTLTVEEALAALGGRDAEKSAA